MAPSLEYCLRLAFENPQNYKYTKLSTFYSSGSVALDLSAPWCPTIRSCNCVLMYHTSHWKTSTSMMSLLQVRILTPMLWTVDQGWIPTCWLTMIPSPSHQMVGASPTPAHQVVNLAEQTTDIHPAPSRAMWLATSTCGWQRNERKHLTLHEQKYQYWVTKSNSLKERKHIQ